VLQHLRPLVERLYLFGEQDRRPPGWVVHVQTWTDALVAIETDLAASAPA
jgi:hypothetical protein